MLPNGPRLGDSLRNESTQTELGSCIKCHAARGKLAERSGTQEPSLLHVIPRGGEGDKACSYSGGSGVGSAAATLASAITPNASLLI